MSVFWSLFFLAALAVTYLAFVRPELARFKALAAVSTRVGAVEATIRDRIARALTGAKTVILGALGVVTSAISFLPPDILPGLHDVTWSAFVSEGTALKITSGLMIAMIVTHAVGLRRAVERTTRPGA
jgi:hypothetical protein